MRQSAAKIIRVPGSQDTRFPADIDFDASTHDDAALLAHMGEHFLPGVGAGGIALARLHASRIDSSGSTFHNEAASIAIATVKRALEEQTRFAVRNDTTLCHGILGLSEVLLHAASYTDDRDLVLGCRKTVAALSAHYGEVQDWPGGTTGGKLHPSLMLGASGIGHHILRLYGCGVQPILFVGSEEPTTFPQVA